MRTCAAFSIFTWVRTCCFHSRMSVTLCFSWLLYDYECGHTWQFLCFRLGLLSGKLDFVIQKAPCCRRKWSWLLWVLVVCCAGFAWFFRRLPAWSPLLNNLHVKRKKKGACCQHRNLDFISKSGNISWICPLTHLVPCHGYSKRERERERRSSLLEKAK